MTPVVAITSVVILALSALGAAGRDGRQPQGSSDFSPIRSRLNDRNASTTYNVKNYLLDFAGDHSLSAATVTEEPADGRATYTVRLQLASGTEQSVMVAGPPGGLEIEMHDMTGDHVPNDVVLRPSLFSWLPTVLVNDGHDHFSIVVAGADTGSFSSPQNLGSRRQNGQTVAFLRSSGFRSVYVPASKRLPFSRSRRYPLSAFAQCFARRVVCASRLDRAPPSAV